jgi:hypothetical protein
MKTLCNAEVPQHLSAGLLHTCLSFDVICAFPVFFSFFPSLHRTYLCVQVCVHMMSSLPGLCNACRMPTTSCTCPRNPTYPNWPPMPFQTPRRHTQQFNTQNPFFHPTSRPAVPMVSFYSPFPGPQPTYDPRFQTLGIPSQPPAQTIDSLGPRQPLSPVLQSPAPANNQKRKRAQVDSGKATSSKRTRRAQPQPSNENLDSLSSVPGVGPSSLALQTPSACPNPLADYSPISKASHKTGESKQVASDVWYFMRPLDTRERPIGSIVDPQPVRTKPKTPFVGCRLCPTYVTNEFSIIYFIAQYY